MCGNPKVETKHHPIFDFCKSVLHMKKELLSGCNRHITKLVSLESPCGLLCTYNFRDQIHEYSWDMKSLTRQYGQQYFNLATCTMIYHCKKSICYFDTRVATVD